MWNVKHAVLTSVSVKPLMKMHLLFNRNCFELPFAREVRDFIDDFSNVYECLDFYLGIKIFSFMFKMNEKNCIAYSDPRKNSM